VAIAVATDEQWVALREALGEPEWAADPELATTEGRRRQHDAIDEHLQAWCRARSGDDIVTALWDAGVPVGKVVQPHDQPDLAQLAFRRFFETVDHPVTGRFRCSTLPMRFSRGPEQFHTRHAPLLGEHTVELLAELGLEPAEIDALTADGIIGESLVQAT
jgi:crotonobetainyl-CoA:carnitine CoA-transferase CaiB-like acyl-CoA transferase